MSVKSAGQGGRTEGYPGDVRQVKAALRKQLLGEARLHSAPEREAGSTAICERLRKLPAWQSAGSVLFYAAMPGEVNLWQLLREALGEGKRVGLPVYDLARDCYFAREICDPARDLQPGNIHIPEPAWHCAMLDLNKLDFALIPGVGFTVDGRRLGRGKGYYDRLLANARGWKCGVAFEWQMVSGIPLEPHDVVLDCIVTPIRFTRGA